MSHDQFRWLQAPQSSGAALARGEALNFYTTLRMQQHMQHIHRKRSSSIQKYSQGHNCDFLISYDYE